MDFQHITRLLFSCGSCECHWELLYKQQPRLKKKKVSSLLLCTLSRFFIFNFKGPKSNQYFQIISPLLPCWNGGCHDNTETYINNLSVYLHVIFHQVIFSYLSTPITKMPHASLYRHLRLSFFQTSSCLFLFALNGNDCSFLSVVFTMWNTHQGFHYSKL